MEVASQRTAPVESPLTIDRVVEGPITCLRLHGVINESFEGRRLAGGIKAQTLILDFGEIKRISSFGIREWSEFIDAVERNVQRIVAIELQPKLVDQLNMVARFFGSKGIVYSFYAPYRCDYCDRDSRVLLQVDRDRTAIVSGNPPERTCESCSRPEYFDEDAATFFGFMASQAPFEMPTATADFLAAKLKYAIAGNDRRLQIDKHVEGKSTYVKLVGNLDGSFPSTKIAEGLEGTVVVDVAGVGTIDLAGAAEWRNFVTMSKQGAERTMVLGCPPILLERLNRQGDLGDVLVSFSMPYSCQKCATTSSQMIDVAEHYEILKFATPPEMKCPQCKSATVCSAPESLLSRLRTLAKPELDAGLKKFIKESRERKPARAATPAARPAAPAQRTGLLMTFMLVVLVGVAGLLVLMYVRQPDRAAVAAPPPGETPAAEIQRPPWVTSDAPLFAYCNDMVSQLSCVGVSAYSKSREDGQAEATNAALEAMTNSIALRIADKTFDAKVRSRFDARRAEALAALEQFQADPKSEDYKKAVERVRDARKRVSQSFRQSGGSAAPAQQAAWFWEEYENGKEYLVFVQFVAGAESVRKLADEYTSIVEVGGARVLTAFPQIAWSVPGTIDGALVVDPGPLAGRGVEAGDVIVALGGQAVRNAGELANRFEESKAKPLTVVANKDGARHDLK